ncbi:MAG TPA: hypothetical protein VLJ11_15625 [Bryobacteraceae bacterium]|nr:hypothetical protein [Bryobacteraceae bacterium]
MNRLRGVSDTTSGERIELEYPAYRPPIPRDLAELKLSQSMPTDLLLRHLRTRAVSSFSSVSESMKVSPRIVEALVEQMRKLQLIEVKGVTGLDYSFTLTREGRNLAAERSEMCRYAGPTPVSLDEYSRAVRAQRAQVKVDRTRLRAALSDLVVSDSLLDQLGPALVSQRSMFLYGPTGNGKTSYSERLTRIYEDSVAIPYAVEIDGQIISIYDPVVHRSLPVEKDAALDPRWVVCRRPCLIAGGELASSSLDLRFDNSSGTYVAPVQMKANNGIFVIDDFGRQAMLPRELLNRWMVPLDRRADYLSLSYGTKFEIPFELLVVFSTNLNPSDLADEAFLRRIPNKVYVGDVDDLTFDRIFERESSRQKIPCDPDGAEHLRQLCKRHGGDSLRACYPGDICRILHWISEYEERPVHATKGEFERAVELYFAQNTCAGENV